MANASIQQKVRIRRDFAPAERWNPHSALDHADRLFGDRRIVAVEAVCGCNVFPGFGLLPALILYVMRGILSSALISPEIAPSQRRRRCSEPDGHLSVTVLVSFVPLTVLIMLVLGSILGASRHPPKPRQWVRSVPWLLAAVYPYPHLEEGGRNSVFLTAKATAMVLLVVRRFVDFALSVFLPWRT